MKYKELIQFEPIEDVIQLRQSTKKDIAKSLVSTYVISDQMQEKLSNIVFPQLQFDKPADNKGMLIVGNYGTGKSHLMAVISALAEDETFLESVQNDQVKKDAKDIAGKFKVKRLEIGAVATSFRDIVISNLEEFLEDEGIQFQFHEADQIDSNKRDFEQMMAKFHEKNPDKGVLLIVDELLDFLRSKKDQQLILDLGFLRELGEICGYLKFRFIAGVQEAIFDSPGFQFVADSLKRVKARFEQVLIVRDDIKYVVAHRLLKKTDEQKSRIRDHLSPYQVFFPPLQERMEEFVELFPVHPDYIEVFDTLTVAEKREVLKALSFTMKKILDADVPEDSPGVISYDSYWPLLKGDPAFRTIPDIRQVIECSDVLVSRVTHAFTRPQYKNIALRIINGLSINRLTMNDIASPLGPTTEELKDTMCLYYPGIGEMGGVPDQDLLSLVETVLTEIHRTVNGQFISKNKENGQYYLDLEKTEDYDAKIEQKSLKLDDPILDRYYYAFLRRAMECADDTYVTGYHIWEHELEWISHKVTRRGYLFFGSPNERSTAVPPRDFYLYFLQPYEPYPFKDEQKEDELFFYLTGKDDAFDVILRNYAAAAELESVSSGNAKKIYQSKIAEYSGQAFEWLNKHMMRAFEVVYRGTRKPLIEWIKGKQPGAGLDSLRDAVNAAASICFEPHFSALCPEYPQFSVLITGENMMQAVTEALRGIIGQNRTRQSRAMLDALKLLEGDQLLPANSPYAKKVLSMMEKDDEPERVLNRSEIIEEVHGVEFFAPDQYRLEPELLVVVLVALVYSGDIILSIPGKTLDASNIQDVAGIPVEELKSFKYIKKPKEWNVGGLRALFELLGMSPGNAQKITLSDTATVRDLQSSIREKVESLLATERVVEEGFQFWTTPLFNTQERSDYKKELEQIREFLDGLQQFDTPGKFKNFRFSEQEIKGYTHGIDQLKELKLLRTMLQDIEPLVSYLTTAQAVLQEDAQLQEELEEERRDISGLLKDKEARKKPNLSSEIKERLEKLKKKYIGEYIDVHRRVRLTAEGDKKKKKLMHDVRLKELDILSTIDLLPHQGLTQFKNELASMRTCYTLSESDLEQSPVCPQCGFKPLQEDCSISVDHHLSQMDDNLEKLHNSWVTTLYNNLQDPTVKQNFELLKGEQKKVVENFLQSKNLPDEVSGTFVETVQELLSGLYKIPVKMDELKDALFKDGSPLKPEELKERFATYMKNKLETREQGKVRFVLE